MPSINYNLNIPDGPNNPSNDQPDMKENTNSINQWTAVDHYQFSDNTAGKHKQSRYVTSTMPAGLVNGEGTLYTKSSTGSQLFYSPDNTGREYQMTRTIEASWATFGVNTGAGSSGWSFLPGGLILQWGVASGGSPANITFPVTYTTGVFSITLGNAQTGLQFYISASSASGFTITRTSGAGMNVFWMSIGK